MSLFALICLTLSIVIYILYTSYTYIKYSPSCISETYYHIRRKDLFTLWLVIVSFLIFPSWVEISPENIQFLPFLSVIFLSIVGISPKYLDEDRKVHIVSALLTSTISLIWSAFCVQYMIPIVLGIAIILLIMKPKNLLFWVENLAFLNIYLSILLS